MQSFEHDRTPPLVATTSGTLDMKWRRFAVKMLFVGASLQMMGRRKYRTQQENHE